MNIVLLAGIPLLLKKLFIHLLTGQGPLHRKLPTGRPITGFPVNAITIEKPRLQVTNQLHSAKPQLFTKKRRSIQHDHLVLNFR